MTSISFPGRMKATIDAEAKAAGFIETSEFIGALVEDYRARKAELAAALAEGESSGIDLRSMDEILSQGRKRATR